MRASDLVGKAAGFVWVMCSIARQHFRQAVRRLKAKLPERK